jgi:hypothetical protein
MMRILFLFFLLLNAVYFYTQFGDAGDSASSTILKQPPLPPGVEKLVLLRERGLGVKSVPQTTNPLPSSVSQKVASAPPAKPVLIEKPQPQKSQAPKKSREPACFTLGPFADAGAASRSTEALKKWGVVVTSRQSTQRTPKAYWVYLPESTSYQAAKRKVQALQKKGLSDLFIMGDGSHKNAISLGLFNQENTADERLQQVKKLGLNAVLETQYRLSSQTWLDLTVTDGKTATVAAITEIADAQRQTSLSQRKCQ